MQGISFFPLLFIVFLTLKLTATIDWSWWWVSAPLWGPLALILAVGLLVGIAMGVAGGVWGVCIAIFGEKK